MNARERHIAEMVRLKEAMRNTKSRTLRVDYGKRINKMKKELEEYDKWKGGKNEVRTSL